MDYKTPRDWAVENKDKVAKMAQLHGDPFLNAIALAYSISDTHQGRKLLNGFEDEFEILFKIWKAGEEGPKETLGADVNDNVSTEDNVEEETEEEYLERQGG